jgi:hypothetical protein
MSLAMANHILNLKTRLLAHQRVLGEVRVLLIKGDARAALDALDDVVVSYTPEGPVGRLPGEWTGEKW